MKRKVRRNYTYIRIYIEHETFLYMIVFYSLSTEDLIVDHLPSLMFEGECQYCQDNVNSSSVRTTNIKNQWAQMIVINASRILKTWPHCLKKRWYLKRLKNWRHVENLTKNLKANCDMKLTKEDDSEWLIFFYSLPTLWRLFKNRDIFRL